jgi:hypothetical protein
LIENLLAMAKQWGFDEPVMEVSYGAEFRGIDLILAGEELGLAPYEGNDFPFCEVYTEPPG